MNRLSIEKREQIIGLLVEGMSMRAVTRIVGCSINTVTKLLDEVGFACNIYQSETLRNLTCKRIQCDVIWAFCHSKECNVAPVDKGFLGHGDVWTYTAIDSDTKLMVSYMVGKRDADYALAFMNDIAGRLSSRVQLSTDRHGPYLNAVQDAFGADIHFGMLVKQNGSSGVTDQRRCSPAEFVSAQRRAIASNPDEAKNSTAHVERDNLTMLMGMRRFTRLTNGFSKKVENLEDSVSLHFMHYNFARIHKTLRVTPAMEAGVSDHVWTLAEIATLVD